MYNIFTIDVEGHVGSEPVDRLIYGKTDKGKLCGIDLLMDILENYNIKGLFFVDIAEAWDYGKEKLTQVLRHIKMRGHDVGVHIHPDHMADKKRLFLSEYSKIEQYQIISMCTDLYEQALGVRPLSFRAGKYSANRETLDIIAQLGYKVDFSEFYGQKWCHIDPPVAKVNVQRLDNGLIEIPVTSYISLDTIFYSRYDKMDCGQTFSEFKTLYKQLNRNNNDIAVLFAHSFSLLDWRRTPNSPIFNSKLKKRLIQQLDFVKVSNNNSIDLKEAIQIFTNYKYKQKSLENESFVTLKGLMPYYWFALRAYSVLKSKYDIKFREL